MTRIEPLVRGPGINACAMRVDNDELYVFLWDDGRHLEAIRRACDFADRADLSFTWRDARLFAAHARRLAAKAEAGGEGLGTKDTPQSSRENDG